MAKPQYEFGPFTLDASECVLRKDHAELQLAPKLYETLLALVEENGRTVSAELLLSKIWPDTIAGKANLEQCISQLRKTLGDNSQQPIYIRTVPKRGYQFICPVKEIVNGETPGSDLSAVMPRELPRREVSCELSQSESNEQPAHRASQTQRRRYLVLVTLLIVLMGALGWLYVFKQPGSAKRHFKPSFVKLPSNGRAMAAAISTDARLIAYGMREASKSNLRIRDTETGQENDLLSQIDDEIWGVTFSRDGKYLYYNRGPLNDAALYKVDLGAPANQAKLLNQIGSPITISPDGKQIAFIQNYPSDGESVLMVANADGTVMRRLVVRRDRLFQFLAGPSWSPDGKTLALIEDGFANSTGVVGIEVADGTSRSIPLPAEWVNYRDLEWMPDGKGLTVAVRERGMTEPAQIWQVPFTGGDPRRITKDTNNYESISLARDTNVMIAVARRQDSDIWLVPEIENPSTAHPVSATNEDGRWGTCWTSDGQIIFYSAGDRSDLFVMNADGTGRRDLTPGSHQNYYPSVSFGKGQVVFMSNRTGSMHIWRMDADGNNQMQLSAGADEQFPQVSADGNWAYYVSWNIRGVGQVWRVSTSGGEPKLIVTESSYNPIPSPDGKLLSYVHVDNDGKAWLRKVIPAEGGVVRFSFGGPLATLRFARWTPTSDAILYLDQKSGAGNIWRQPLNGGVPKQLTFFDTGTIWSFDLSRDGKALLIARGDERKDVFMIAGY